MGTERIDCPKCGQEAQKIMSTCSFSLKGGGWYADGYGLKKTENTASKTQTVSENKTENKPTSESNPS
jgi:predicted nucleic acid-binding Zn ribbon protein